MFDKVTFVFVFAILAVTGANFAGFVSDTLAMSLFILLPTMGFAYSRQQVCRLRKMHG